MRRKISIGLLGAGLFLVSGLGSASALTINTPGAGGSLQPVAPGGPADGPGVTDGQGETIDGAWESHDRTDNDVIGGA